MLVHQLSMMATGEVISVMLALVASTVRAHKDGAPTSACLTMTPGHTGTAPKPLDSAIHRLEVSPASGAGAGDNSSSSYVLTLSAKSVGGDVGGENSHAFKGFFLQARSTTSGDANPVGTCVRATH
jgi:hypothetical protein